MGVTDRMEKGIIVKMWDRSSNVVTKCVIIYESAVNLIIYCLFVKSDSFSEKTGQTIRPSNQQDLPIKAPRWSLKMIIYEAT